MAFTRQSTHYFRVFDAALIRGHLFFLEAVMKIIINFISASSEKIAEGRNSSTNRILLEVEFEFEVIKFELLRSTVLPLLKYKNKHRSKM